MASDPNSKVIMRSSLFDFGFFWGRGGGGASSMNSNPKSKFSKKSSLFCWEGV